MATEPETERTPIGMRLIWLLLPAVLFGLYFLSLLRDGSGARTEEPSAPAVETEVEPER